MNDEPVDVLIVEDIQPMPFMIEEMLKDLKIELNITSAEDGLEAVNLLKNKGTSRCRPDHPGPEPTEDGRLRRTEDA